MSCPDPRRRCGGACGAAQRRRQGRTQHAGAGQVAASLPRGDARRGGVHAPPARREGRGERRRRLCCLRVLPRRAQRFGELPRVADRGRRQHRPRPPLGRDAAVHCDAARLAPLPPPAHRRRRRPERTQGGRLHAAMHRHAAQPQGVCGHAGAGGRGRQPCVHGGGQVHAAHARLALRPHRDRGHALPGGGAAHRAR